MHAGDITGREVRARAARRLRRAPEHPVLPRRRGDRPHPRPRGARADSRGASAPTCCSPNGEIETFLGRVDGARHRRRGQGLPLHDQPGRGDRRRRGDGLPGGRARSPTWSSTSSTPPASITPRPRTSSSARRCAARAASSGCAAAQRVHGALPPAGRAGPARHRGPRHRRRAEAHRRRLRAPGHDPPGTRVPRRALPQHLRDLQGVRHRHGGAAHPGGARGALPVRRRGRPTCAAAPRVPGLYAVGEVALHRAARRQPAGLQLAARGPGVRPPRGAGGRRGARRGGRSRARPPDVGPRRGGGLRRERASSPTTGTRSAG